LQRVQSGDGGSARRGDHVFQAAGMLIRFKEQLRRTEDGLRREELGGAAGEADFYARIAERFENEKDIRGSGAGKPGDSVELRLLERDRDAHGVEDPLCIVE